LACSIYKGCTLCLYSHVFHERVLSVEYEYERKFKTVKRNVVGICLKKFITKFAVVCLALALVGEPVFARSAAQELEAWLSKSSKNQNKTKVANKKLAKVTPKSRRNSFRKTKKVASKPAVRKSVRALRKVSTQAKPKKIAKASIPSQNKTWKVDKKFSVRDLFMQKFSPVEPALKVAPKVKKQIASKPRTTKKVVRSIPKKLPQQVANKVESKKPAKQVVQSAEPKTEKSVQNLAMKPAANLPQSAQSYEAVQPASKDVLTNALNIVNRRGMDKAGGRRPGSPQQLVDTTGTFVDKNLDPSLAYHFNDRNAEYANVKIQFVDDRSNAELGQVFPVGGVHVHLVGTDLKMAADAKGKVELTSMPVDSRFFLRVRDPAGRIESRLVEVKVKPGTQKVNLYRKNQLDVLMQAVSVKPFPGTGNLCGVVRRRGINLDGVAVALNAQFDGPFYFDRSGVLDPRMRVTGRNGLFCLFNVDPGIKLISLFQGSSHLVDLPTSFQAESASFKELDIAGIGGLRLATKTLASTSSQLPVYSGSQSGVDMIPLGYSLPLTVDQRGVHSSTYEIVRMDGLIRLFSRGTDVEPAIYNMEKEDTAFVADILPRGFIEDLAIKNQTTVQKGFGSLFGRYGYLAGLNDHITAELYDEKGVRIESVESISSIDKDHEQFSFFNVKPGHYMIVIKDKKGDWLQSETALVYADATSVLSLGSRTTFQ